VRAAAATSAARRRAESGGGATSPSATAAASPAARHLTRARGCTATVRAARLGANRPGEHRLGAAVGHA
jgi:hypothetical protein